MESNSIDVRIISATNKKLLLNHFLKIYSMRMDKKINSFSSDALKVLIKYPWYGNVRELKNVVEFSVNMTNNNIITVNNLPKDILHLNRLKKGNLNIDYHTKQLIAEALKNYGDTTIGKEKAAMALGISMATLYRKMKEYNI